MATAFFSYPRKADRNMGGALLKAARTLAQDVANHRPGFELFIDQRSIRPGDDWVDRIKKELDDALIYVPALSPEFFASEHCVQEANYFLERASGTPNRLLILPLYVVRDDQRECSEDPLREVLYRKQCVDLCTALRNSSYHARRRELLIAAADQIINHLRETESQATRARRHPRAPLPWAASSGTDEFGHWASVRVAGQDLTMRWIPPGSFWMGSVGGELGRYDDEFLHRVVLTRGFWIADVPCTQELFLAVMGDNPSRFRSPLRPVENVTFDDAAGFCAKLGDLLGGLCRPRLPTEAEWEYACRGERQTDQSTGGSSVTVSPEAWWLENAGKEYDLEDGEDLDQWSDRAAGLGKGGTHAVRLRPRNPRGLFDMLGNVWEWCADWYEPYPGGARDDPHGAPLGSCRVARGGAWCSSSRAVRPAARMAIDPQSRGSELGFRIVWY